MNNRTSDTKGNKARGEGWLVLLSDGCCKHVTQPAADSRFSVLLVQHGIVGRSEEKRTRRSREEGKLCTYRQPGERG